MQDEYESVMCSDCAGKFPYLKLGNDTVKVRHCMQVVAAARYDGVVKDAVRRFKFGACMSYAKQFGRILAEKLTEHPEIRCDLITWVPVSRRRFRKRGYDQAKLLAEEVSKSLRLPAKATLRKVCDVPPQSSLRKPEERRANVAGAYAVKKSSDVKGKKVLLIDDVLTSGSTMSECASELMAYGAAAVYGAAFASANRVSVRKSGTVKRK